MKRQTRPFTVEVKQKRGKQKPGRSIWSGFDLPRIAAEAQQPDLAKSPNRELVDSGPGPIDAEQVDKGKAEHYMPDPQEAGSAQIAAETPAALKAAEPARPARKASRARKAKAEPKQPVRKSAARKPAAKAAEASAQPVRAARKTYSGKERARMLGQIEKAISNGSTIRSAVGEAGISEQTYYQWKKAAALVEDSGDLKDLLALEEENKRLKSLLAERLRKENAELKKKLGLN